MSDNLDSSKSSSSISLDQAVETVSERRPEKPSNLIAHEQEKTRTRIATLLVYSLIVTIAASFFSIFVDKILISLGKSNPENQEAKELITLFWTSQTALVGSVLGFYFGNQRSDKRGDE